MKQKIFFVLISLVFLGPPNLFSSDWAQVNLDGFDPDFYYRGMLNYGVFDDSFSVFNGNLYAGTDNLGLQRS